MTCMELITPVVKSNLKFKQAENSKMAQKMLIFGEIDIILA